jgi:hypothetical protein
MFPLIWVSHHCSKHSLQMSILQDKHLKMQSSLKQFSRQILQQTLVNLIDWTLMSWGWGYFIDA